jgi:hypothetical protein
VNASAICVTVRQLGKLGRLGNQLFQVAAAIGLAARQRGTLLLPHWPMAASFAGPFVQRRERAIPRTAEWIEPSYHYVEIPKARGTDLVGYFQSERYFEDCAPLVRTLFRPEETIAQRVDAIMNDLNERGALCSLHVRRGDYVNHPTYVSLFENGYYERALRLFPSDTLFVVCSDDLDFCRHHFRDKNTVFINDSSATINLHVMARCSAHIIANSTFSWWSAWLDPNPKKRVIAPGKWFGPPHDDPTIPFTPGPPHTGYFDERDLIPADWICI